MDGSNAICREIMSLLQPNFTEVKPNKVCQHIHNFFLVSFSFSLLPLMLPFLLLYCCVAYNELFFCFQLAELI